MLQEHWWPILFALLFAIPYSYVIARTASIGYFQEKLRYHVNIMTTMEEDPNGKRKRA